VSRVLSGEQFNYRRLTDKLLADKPSDTDQQQQDSLPDDTLVTG